MKKRRSTPKDYRTVLSVFYFKKTLDKRAQTGCALFVCEKYVSGISHIR